MNSTWQLLVGTLLLILLGSAEAKALLSQNHAGDEWRSTPKYRVMGYAERAPGRLAFLPPVKLQLAMGCAAYGYENASGQGYYCNGDPVNGLDPDGRLGKSAIEDELNGGPGADLLRAGGNYLNSIAPNSSSMTLAFGESYVGGLMNEVGGMNLNNASSALNSFGNNINTEYQQAGLYDAGAYALTSWNLGAIESSIVNVNPITGQPVGNGLDRVELGLSGVAGTTALVAPITATFESTPALTILDQNAYHQSVVNNVADQLADQDYSAYTTPTTSNSASSARFYDATGASSPTQADIVAIRPDGTPVVFEVKTGGGGLSEPQEAIYPQIENGSAIPSAPVGDFLGLENPGAAISSKYPNGIQAFRISAPGLTAPAPINPWIPAAGTAGLNSTSPGSN